MLVASTHVKSGGPYLTSSMLVWKKVGWTTAFFCWRFLVVPKVLAWTKEKEEGSGITVEGLGKRAGK